MADISLASLSMVNFLVADMQTGFGAFVSVHLTANGWAIGQIGGALSAGTIATIAAQIPAGMLVDGSSNKRNVAGAAIVASMLALLVVGAASSHASVVLALVLAGIAGPVLNLSIAAITLALSRQDALGERLGQNARFAAAGAAVGAALLGLIGTTISNPAVFVLAAAAGVPALWAMFRIRRSELIQAHRRTSHHTAPPPAARRSPPMPKWRVLCDRRLLAFLACCAAFHLTNASLLPLAAAEAARKAGHLADIITGAATVVPQLLVVALSPWVGRMASRHGRRIMLLLGFAALPARALFFSLDSSSDLLVLGQTLDGISGSVFGVLLPLVVADITHRGGRFNFALGMAGVACSAGAAASTTMTGLIADAAGLPTTFLVLAGFGAGATALVWLIMPETAHLPAAVRAPRAAAPAH